jgi:hypothetical protein
MKTSIIKVIVALFLIIFVGAVLFGSLTGCRSPQQRHDVLTLKYGDLCTIDTVIVKDTIIKITKVPVPERRDSFIITADTVIESKMFIIEKYGNKFRVTAKRDTISFRDTIPYEVKVPGKSYVKKSNDWEQLIIVFLLGVILGFGIAQQVHKK